MVKGFILIKTKPEKEHEVYNTLHDDKEISNVRPLFGEYDLLAEIEVNKFIDLERIVAKKIKILDGIIKIRIRK